MLVTRDLDNTSYGSPNWAALSHRRAALLLAVAPSRAAAASSRCRTMGRSGRSTMSSCMVASRSDRAFS
jgi:hypothetical protein